MTGLYLILFFLILNHIVFDFYLQPSSWVASKNRKKIKAKSLYLHALLHGIGPILIFYFIGKVEFTTCLIYCAIIMVTHLFIDIIKLYLPSNVLTYIGDQLLHLIVIVLVVFIMGHFSVESIYNTAINLIKLKYIILLISYSLVLKPVSIVISEMLKPWAGSVRSANTNGTLDSAGEKIGYFERFLVLTFILSNQFSAIGFLLAAKSVFRFGDLKNDEDKKMTEYVMLGTLISFTNVIIIGLITSFLLGYVGKIKL